jgi:DNA-binding CsgD family transcriptional regulator
MVAGPVIWAQTQMKRRLDALSERIEDESGEAGPDYGDPRLRCAEFDIMIDEMLGADYDPRKRRHLLKIEASLRADQSELDTALDKKAIAPASYLARLREIIANTAHAYEAVLGSEDYVRLFGTQPEEASAVIDPSITSTRPENDAASSISDPDLQPNSDEYHLRELYALTAVEARLAVCLSQGKSVDEAASAMGVTVNTARTYLKRIYSKTGVRRQTELVRLLLLALPRLDEDQRETTK